MTGPIVKAYLGNIPYIPPPCALTPILATSHFPGCVDGCGWVLVCVYIYIYVCVCVCVHVCNLTSKSPPHAPRSKNTKTTNGRAFTHSPLFWITPLPPNLPLEGYFEGWGWRCVTVGPQTFETVILPICRADSQRQRDDTKNRICALEGVREGGFG